MQMSSRRGRLSREALVLVLLSSLVTTCAAETERPETKNVCVIRLQGEETAPSTHASDVGPLKHVGFNCTGTQLPVAVRVHPAVLKAVVVQEGVELTADDEVRGLIQFEDVRDLTVLDSVFEGLSGGILAPVVFDRSAGLFYNCRFAKNSCARTGGIYASSGSLMHVYDTIFEGNKGGRYGAVFTTHGCRTLFRNTKFVNNIAGPCDPGYEGYVSGAVFSFQNTLTEFEDCLFEKNAVVGAGAGAITGVKRAVFRMQRCLVQGNSGSAGAISLSDVSSGTFEETRVVHNEAIGESAAIYLSLRSHLTVSGGDMEGNSGASGVILARDGSVLNITSSSFRQNVGWTYGGAVSSALGGEVTVLDCIFEQNAGVFGGATYQDRLKEVVIQNSTFLANKAGAAGGAVFQLDVGHAVLISSSFEDNSAGSVGGGVAQIGCGERDWIESPQQSVVVCPYERVPTCGEVEISKCSFGENVAPTGEAVFQEGCVNLVVTSSLFDAAESVMQRDCEKRKFSSEPKTAAQTENCPDTPSPDRKLMSL